MFTAVFCPCFPTVRFRRNEASIHEPQVEKYRYSDCFLVLVSILPSLDRSRLGKGDVTMRKNTMTSISHLRLRSASLVVVLQGIFIFALVLMFAPHVLATFKADKMRYSMDSRQLFLFLDSGSE